VTSVTTYHLCAKRWEHGWELHIEGVGITQSRTLRDAEDMARDLISRRGDLPEDAFTLTGHPGDRRGALVRKARGLADRAFG
jgi:hypothetical protein